MLEIEDVHVVHLLGDPGDASEQDSVPVLVQTEGVPTSDARGLGRIQVGPSPPVEIKLPEIVQLVVVGGPAEDVEFGVVDQLPMTRSRDRRWIVGRLVAPGGFHAIFNSRCFEQTRGDTQVILAPERARREQRLYL